MKKELEQQLVNKYPNLLKYYRQDPKLPLYYGMECGDGWFDLINECLEAIQEEINSLPKQQQDKFTVHQIKEKFGTLRLYMSDSDYKINQIINDAYTKSLKICAKCGSNEGVIQNEKHFIRSLCPVCMKEFSEQGYSLNGEF